MLLVAEGDASGVDVVGLLCQRVAGEVDPWIAQAASPHEAKAWE